MRLFIFVVALPTLAPLCAAAAAAARETKWDREGERERETAIEREVGKAKSRNQHFVAADCCFVFLYSSYSLFRLFVLHTKFDNCGSGEGVSLFKKKKEEEEKEN